MEPSCKRSAYTHIVFDIDGTLVDTAQTGLLSLQQTVRELLGRQMTLPQLYPYFGIPSWEAVQKLQFPHPKHAAQVWEEHFQELMHLAAPFPGVDQTLETLHGKGCVLGLVTSRSRMEFDNDPYLHAWLPYFTCSVCAEDTVGHKPLPDPLLYFMKNTHAQPAQTLYIGDTPHDAQCARAAGVDFGLALWGAMDPHVEGIKLATLSDVSALIC